MYAHFAVDVFPGYIHTYTLDVLVLIYISSIIADDIPVPENTVPVVFVPVTAVPW